MKTLFWILLLLNLLTFAYFKSETWTASDAPTQPELNAEQLQVLKESDLVALPPRVASTNPTLPSPNSDAAAPTDSPASEANHSAENSEVAATHVAASTQPTSPQPPSKPTETEASPTPKKSPEVYACYEWGSFNHARLNEIIALTEKWGIQYNLNQQTAGTENRRYWIYKPPLASAEAAQAKAEELRKLGIEDFFVVQDPKWRNAISFGVFKDEKLADHLMEDLKRKGVRSLVKATRFGGEGNVTLKLQHVSTKQWQDLKNTQPQFPDAVLKEIPCQ